MKLVTSLLNAQTVVSHYLCETEEELNKAEAFIKAFKSREANMRWLYKDKEYFGCIVVFTEVSTEII